MLEGTHLQNKLDLSAWKLAPGSPEPLLAGAGNLRSEGGGGMRIAAEGVRVTLLAGESYLSFHSSNLSS